MNQKSTNTQYKCLTFLVMLQISLFICHLIFKCKLIVTSLGILSIGSVIVPSWWVLSDIITEVYGFKMATRLYWYAVTIIFVFSIIIFIVINLPSPLSWHESDSFKYIFKNTGFLFLYALTMSLPSFRINAYLLIKWKIFLKGKYFWIRSISSLIISDIIFNTLMIPAWIFSGPGANIQDAIHLSATALITRLIFYLISAPLSTFIVNLLKVIEQVDPSEMQFNFNPFAKSIKEI